MAMRQSFKVFSGNDVTLAVTLVDSEEMPLILLGTQELIWEVARRSTDQTALITKKLSEGGITIIDQASGQIEIAIASEDTEAMLGIFYHELRITNQGSKKVTLMYGPCEITNNLVRE